MKTIEEAREKIRIIDRQMADLFVKRMEAVRDVARYKKEKGLQIYDEEQEKKVLNTNSSYVEDEVLRQYYLMFMQDTMDISKKYQEALLHGEK